ncbi:alkaline phosphatase [Halobacteriovorax sp. BALOs_7]|uniref:alkaline phosphatase n=1 Tax=Halobacteriovorax sp. BALOs_7 TaxID=2109558 RepID=UPI000EA3C0E9|nr:alkaline phosphatase [Halobacteriovorax sp. BALOs_7]AYF44382.1 alkaline phosphatase [Halobacteriovorax sp. BALOs_7]
MINRSISSTFFLSALLLLSSCMNSSPSKGPKNLILMIGDGMGPGQISLLNYYLKHNSNPKMKNVRYAFANMNTNQLGVSATQPYGSIVVDSACSATQLATGTPSRSEMIGLDKEGEIAKTILEKAQKKGLKTGLVSDTRLTHATPASFAAHVANRWSEDRIAQSMIEVAPDLMFSGGANRFVPKGTKSAIEGHFTLKSKRKDDRNLLQEAKDKGFQVIHKRSELTNIDPSKKVLGLFTNHNMPEALWFRDKKEDESREIPTLLEMSKSAVETLSKNDDGFFLMIEGGQIDWAGHQNDAGSMLHEMLSFNETVNWISDWVSKNPDTLLVITADHETGGFGFGYNIGKIEDEIELSGSVFKDRKFKTSINYGPYRVLDLLYSQKTNLIKLWDDFLDLEKSQQTSSTLCDLIEETTSVRLSVSKCSEILAKAIEEKRRRKNLKLYKGEVPKFRGYHDHYYYDLKNIRTSLIAKAIASEQNVVWATSGHTAAPVHVYTKGHVDWAKEFSGQLTHPQIGDRLQKVLGL